MGIHGIYKEIGPGERVALSKLAVQKFEETGRPLRIAIDTSIWLFQIQSSKGGTNPALRTFYYRLLRLLSLSIHPLFVFDGPNKPPFKRNKRTGPNIASIPEFLAKQLLKQFGFPFHVAPGEAEAECALLQREEIVDAVLSEDVDTLMFGSRLTLRNWSPEGSKSKTPTHVNMYDAEETRRGPSGLDREGMVLIALMSGGDYIPEGIPGCGPKLACEAARAGFGRDLCKILRSDEIGLRVWRERLAHELRTNERKFFKRKHPALSIPENFPNPEVLGYYTHPVVSSSEKLERLKASLKWDEPINFSELRTFTADAFNWTKQGGAKKFIRNLAPALLVRELRLRGQMGDSLSENLEIIEAEEAKLVKSIHGKRNHPSTDGTTELRIAFKAIDLVSIDLDAEEPDDERSVVESDLEGEPPDERDERNGHDDTIDATGSPSKTRQPIKYDPLQLEKIWIFETFVKVGVPLIVQDWEESFRNVKKYNAMKHANKAAGRGSKAKAGAANRGLQKQTMHQFMKVTKAGLCSSISSDLSSSSSKLPTSPTEPQPARTASKLLPNRPPSFRLPPLPVKSSLLPTVCKGPQTALTILPSANPNTDADYEERAADHLGFLELPPTVTKRRRSPLKRSQTDTICLDLSIRDFGFRSSSPELVSKGPEREFATSVPSPSPKPAPSKKARSARQNEEKLLSTALCIRSITPKKQTATISLLSSSPGQQMNIEQYFSPAPLRQTHELRGDIFGRNSPPSSPTSMRRKCSQKANREPLEKTSANGRTAPDPLRSNRMRLSGAMHPSKFISAQPAEEVDLSYVAGSAASRSGFSLARLSSSQQPTSAASDKTAPRRSPRIHRSADPVIHKTARNGKAKKSVIRVRESLAGAFAVEEIDLSATPSSTSAGALRTKFRSSEVSILDLTCD